jgi:hypothetical protein
MIRAVHAERHLEQIRQFAIARRVSEDWRSGVKVNVVFVSFPFPFSLSLPFPFP